MTAARRFAVAVAALAAVAIARPASAQILGSLVSPGALHRTHQAIDGGGNCLRCHSQGRQVDGDKCLSCHKPVADRIAAKRGVHRAVTTDCVSCHVEHTGRDGDLRHFDPQGFDHAREAGYPLDGLHAATAANCAACHKTRSFLGVSTSCASCHADPHKPTLGTDCTRCHSTTARFTAAATSFDHSRARFRLAGAHAKVECLSCHKNRQYTGLAFSTCTSCHQDPHKSTLGASCTSCHTEASWKTVKVDHARTAFPLRGKHADVECAKCHVKPATTAKVPFDTCAGCHKPDPHRGTFKQDCGACHNETTFKGATFDHDSATRFRLVDKHAGLACVSCHKTSSPAANDFKGARSTCDACHADVHRGELGTTCERCHTNARSFEVRSFTHANNRAFFAGQHAPLGCEKCHADTMKPTRSAAAVPALRVGYISTATACAGCHKDPHLGQFARPCEACHAVDVPKFAVRTFDHSATRFTLTGKHAPLACEKCHKPETAAFPAGHGNAIRYSGVDAACASCHQDPHRGRLDANCQSCHSTETFAVPRYTHKRAKTLRDFFTGRHASAACGDCHKPLPPAAGAPVATKAAANYGVTTTCTNCHADVHRGALGSACDSCHKP